MLLLCAKIRTKVGAEYSREADDTLRLTREQFREEFLACRRRWAEGWGKEKREQFPDSLCQELIAEMSGWGMWTGTAVIFAVISTAGITAVNMIFEPSQFKGIVKQIRSMLNKA